MIRQIGTFLLCYLVFDCSHLVLTLGHHQVFMKTIFFKVFKELTCNKRNEDEWTGYHSISICRMKIMKKERENDLDR